MDHNEQFQLSKLIAWTSMDSTAKWHKCIRLWCNLIKHGSKYQSRRSFIGHDSNSIKDRETVVLYRPYLESRKVEFLRVGKEFRIMMNVPEQRHHLPTFWNQVPCGHNFPKPITHTPHFSCRTKLMHSFLIATLFQN